MEDGKESGNRYISRRRFLQLATGIVSGTIMLTPTGKTTLASAATQGDAPLELVRNAGQSIYFANTPASLSDQYDQLEASLPDLEALFSRCDARGIPTDYEAVNHAVVERFIEYGREDIQRGNQSHAQYVLSVLQNLYEEAESKLNAYLAGTSNPLVAPRYVTGDVAIDDYAFSVDTVVPPGSKVRKRPFIFQGYGHFGQVRKDVPNFEGFGTDIIQIEIGPSSVVLIPNPLEGWQTTTNNGAKVRFDPDTSVYRSGETSVRIENDSPVYPNLFGTMWQTVAVQPTTTYNFSVWVKGENVKYLQFTLTPSWVPRYSAPNGTYDWTEVKWQYTTGPNERSLTFRLLTGDVTDSAWIDDVSMTAEGSSENLIHNPGFEAGAVVYDKDFVIDTSRIRDDIQQVLQNAAEHNIAVNLLLSPHYFPEGAYYKWPELRIGNPGFIKYDINHPKARKIIKAFLETLIPLIKDYTSLHSLCLSNEPDYIDSRSSAYTQSMWHDYLHDLYGTVEKLNATYKAEYESFEDVPVPALFPPQAYPLRPIPYHYDWVRFNNQMFAAWHEWMADIIHGIAPKIPVHAKIQSGFVSFAPGDGSVVDGRFALTRGVDPEEFAEFCQINGNDCFSYLEWGPTGLIGEMKFYDLQGSIKKAPLFNSEDHIIPDYSGNFSPQEATHTRTVLWQGAIHGRSASTIWVWERGFNLMLERPDVVADVGRTSLDMDRLTDEITSFQEDRASVAILYSITSSVYSLSYLKAVSDAYDALSLSGQKVDFITEKQVREGKLKMYKLLVLPETTHVHASTLSGVRKFLQTQGTALLIGDNVLRFSEHDEALSEQDRDYVLQRSVKLPSGTSPEQLKSTVLRLLEDLKLNQVVLLDPNSDQPVNNVEWRSVKHEDGWLVNVANYTQQVKQVRILTEGEQIWVSQDLISGQQLSGDTITLDGLRPYLLRVKRSEQKPGVSTTGMRSTAREHTLANLKE